MIDFAHEKVLLFLPLLAFGNVRNGADDADRSSLMPVALEISKPQGLHPADLAISPPEPELDRRAPRIGGIEPSREGRRNSFRVVGMYPLHDLFKSRLILGNAENFLRARIPREYAAERMVLPPPELSCVHGKLQTRLVRLQVLLRLLARVNIQDHGDVA